MDVELKIVMIEKGNMHHGRVVATRISCSFIAPHVK